MHGTPAYASADVRAAEEPLLAAGEPIMLRAAGALARRVGELRAQAPGPLLVLVGSGDNGGDALFAAALLVPHVTAVRVGARAHVPGLSAAVAAGVRVVDAADPSVDALAAGARWILDGMLGIGVRRPVLRPAAARMVGLLAPRIRSGSAASIAVDLPSGLDPDDGTVAGTLLPAQETVTFGALKAGLVRASGPEAAGALTLVDIGLRIDAAPVTYSATPVRLVDATGPLTQAW